MCRIAEVNAALRGVRRQAVQMTPIELYGIQRLQNYDIRARGSAVSC